MAHSCNGQEMKETIHGADVFYRTEGKGKMRLLVHQARRPR